MSKTDLDNAVAAERTTAAAVKQAQANVDSREDHPRLHPRHGADLRPRGQQQVTEGALVGQGEATLLTTVEQIDPIYVNFSQAVGEIDNLRRAAASGSVHLADANKAKVELLAPTAPRPARPASSISPTPRSTRRPARSACARSCRIPNTRCCPDSTSTCV